jgi:hypothetical protein
MAGYDENYYTNHLDNLYNTDKRIYNTDPLLFEIQKNENKTYQLINKDNYFSGIASIVFASKKIDNVNDCATSATETVCSSIVDSETSVAFKSDIAKEDISVNLTRSGTPDYSLIITPIHLELNVGANIPDNSIIQNHNKMNEYMRNILLTTGKTFLKQAILRLQSTANVTSYENAIETFKSLSETRINLLIDNASNKVREVFKEIIEKKVEFNITINRSIGGNTCEQAEAQYLIDNKADLEKENWIKSGWEHYTTKGKNEKRAWKGDACGTEKKMKYINTNFLDDIKIGGFSGQLYYKLKYQATNRMNSDKTQPMDKKYLNAMIVDLYIKTCYPVIIYDFINIMMGIYINQGDFVNARIALLSKIVYSFSIFNYISQNYNALNTKDAAKVAQNQIVLTTLKAYLIFTNEINLSSTINEMHKTSNTVVDKNQMVQNLKKNIESDQLSLRNVLYNVDELKINLASEKIEFGVLVGLLSVLIISCSVLMFLSKEDNNFKLYALYVAGGFGIAILIFQLTKVISNMVRKKS